MNKNNYSTEYTTAIRTEPGNFPHVKWIDLKGNGIMVEAAIMKEDRHGNIYFFELGKLDDIDRQRILRLLQSRNAHSMELWDLMDNTTLNNGVNALTYFHQLVQIITQKGVLYSPRDGVIGTGEFNTNDKSETTAVQAAAAAAQ